MFRAHHAWRTLAPPERFTRAAKILDGYGDPTADWIVAGREWIYRRRALWEMKLHGNPL